MAISIKGAPWSRTDYPEKLQKARAKQGKPELRPFTTISSEALADILGSVSGQKGGGPKGGKHPGFITPHKRRGHIRTLPKGNLTWVRDTVVGVGEVQKRREYRVTP